MDGRAVPTSCVTQAGRDLRVKDCGTWRPLDRISCFLSSSFSQSQMSESPHEVDPTVPILQIRKQRLGGEMCHTCAPPAKGSQARLSSPGRRAWSYLRRRRLKGRQISRQTPAVGRTPGGFEPGRSRAGRAGAAAAASASRRPAPSLQTRPSPTGLPRPAQTQHAPPGTTTPVSLRGSGARPDAPRRSPAPPKTPALPRQSARFEVREPCGNRLPPSPPAKHQHLPGVAFGPTPGSRKDGHKNWRLEGPRHALPVFTSAGSDLRSPVPFPFCTRGRPGPGTPGASTTTMAATTLLRATPLLSGEGAGKAMAARDAGGVVRSGRARTRALIPSFFPGRSRHRPDPAVAGSLAAAEGPGTAPLVPRPGRGGQEDLRARQAPCERGHHRPCGPRQDHTDRGHHEK